MPIVALPDGREVDFPEGVTPEDMTGALRRDFPTFFQPQPPFSEIVNPKANLLPGMTAVQGGPPLTLPPANVALNAFGEGVNEVTQAMGEGMQFAGNIARAIPADVAAGLSVLKRPDTQPTTLVPSPTAIAGAVRQNLPAAAESSGNIPAALAGTPLPIDAKIAEAAQESTGAAIAAHLSQDLAATAPLLAIGALPAAAQKAAILGFTAKMAVDAPEIATRLGAEIGKPKEQQNPDEIARLVSSAVQTIGFVPLGAIALKRGIQPGVIAKNVRAGNTETAKALAAGEKGKDAIQEQVADAGVLRQERPEVGLPEVAQGVVQGQPAAEVPAKAPGEIVSPVREQGTAAEPVKELENVPPPDPAEFVKWEVIQGAGGEWFVSNGKKTLRATGGESQAKKTANAMNKKRIAVATTGQLYESQAPAKISPAKEQGTAAEQPVPSGGEFTPPPPVNRAVEPSTPPPTPQPESPAGALGTEQPNVTTSVTEAQGAIGTAPPLSPSGAVVSLPPKSRRQIITDLAKGLNIPIRFGRLTTSKYGGYFKKVADLIGSKRPNDIPTVSHEVGHKLDSTFSLSRDPAIAAELDVLGNPATPGSASSWTSSKSRAYKMGEGMAEYVRYWMTDPARAASVAPQTHAAFEAMLNANKDVADVLRQAQSDIQTWRNAEPQMRLRSHISVGDNPNKTSYTLSQLSRDLVDDLHILKLSVDEAKKAGPLPPSKDPYLLARNLRGSYGMAETFVRNGVADFKTKAVTIGKSLEDALKPVAGRMADFRDWIVAKRAQELRGQGKETGLVASDVDAVVNKFAGNPEFQAAFDAVKQWQDSVLQYAVDSGLVTPEGAAAMRTMNQDYVPFHRIFEVGAGEAPSQQAQGIGQGLNVGKPGSLKGMKGSRRDIVDPIETMVKNAYTIITASEKSAINRAVADMSNLPGMGKWVERVTGPKENVKVELDRIRDQLEAAGADLTAVPDDLLLNFFRQGKRAPFGENTIRIVRDGKTEFYRLNRDLHDTFQALDLEDSGKLVRILSAPAQVLRAGVTLEPGFALANIIRDNWGGAVLNKFGALPFEAIIKGVGASINNPKLVAEWAASGGRSAVEVNFFDRAGMQKYLAEKVSKELTPAERAMIVTKSPLTALRKLGAFAEESTRIGEYKIAYDALRKSGMPEGEARRLAAFEARDRQDFAKGGAKTKIVRHMAAFWNAALQSNVVLAQRLRNPATRNKTILQGLAFVTIPKLLEQALNWNDDDYWQRPQWERDYFFMIPSGKDESGHTRFLRIPTPFTIGVIFGTLPGRALQYAKSQEPEAMRGFPQMVLKETVPNPIPNFMLPIFENFLAGPQGYDIFRDRPVVPERIADLPPGEQWTEQTSGIAKEMGKRLGFSPMKIDHLIEQSTGGLGKVVTGKQLPGKRFVTTPLNLSNQATEEFYSTLERLRQQRASFKSRGDSTIPQGLSSMEEAARSLTALRDKARKSTNPKTKADYQEQIFQTTKRALAALPNSTP